MSYSRQKLYTIIVLAVGLLFPPPVFAEVVRCEFLWGEGTAVILDDYKRSFSPRPSVRQCFGTCYFEAAVAHLESRLRVDMGYPVQISRVDLMYKLAEEFLGPHFVNVVSGQIERKGALKGNRFDIFSNGMESEVFSVAAKRGVIVVEPKTQAQIYRENKLLAQMLHEMASDLYQISKKWGPTQQPAWNNMRTDVKQLLREWKQEHPVEGLQELGNVADAKALQLALTDLQVSEEIYKFTYALLDFAAIVDTLITRVHGRDQRLSNLFVSILISTKDMIDTHLEIRRQLKAKIEQETEAYQDKWHKWQGRESSLGLVEVARVKVQSRDRLLEFDFKVDFWQLVRFLREQQASQGLSASMAVWLGRRHRELVRRRGYMDHVRSEDGESDEVLHAMELVDVLWGEDGMPLIFVLRNSWGMGVGYQGHLFLGRAAFSRISEVVALKPDSLVLTPQNE